MRRSCALAVVVSTLSLAALAVAPGAAAPAAKPTAAPSPPISLNVDVRDVGQKIFHVRESLPVSPGPLTLDYPKWIPGEHSPSGPLVGVAGLRISADGKQLAWRRDLAEMYSIHLDVPADTESIDLAFDFLSPNAGGSFGQSVSVTENILALEWNQVIYYPEGRASRDIRLEPSIELPEGWKFATALTTAGDEGDTVRFETVSLAELVDSPLLAGRYFREIALTSPPARPVFLDVAADAPEQLAVSAAQQAGFRELVEQAKSLFGAEHYDHYNFLLVVSDHTGHFGLEHHRSSDDRTFAKFFVEPESFVYSAGLLPHEYVHSWNGKFRRPADLWTADFNRTPMRGDLLWVYEGLTTYWGDVLTARSGLRTPEQYRDALAASAAQMDHRAGRAWRPLQDTADEAQILYYTPGDWQSWRRRTDYYPEGELVWLDADTKIRELSGDKKSLDDFARVFFGMDDGGWITRTYSFDDIVAALGKVQPFDWATFLHERLQSRGEHAPLDGIARGGYELVYTDQPSEYTKAVEKRRRVVDLEDSLGLAVSTDPKRPAEVSDVLWNGPAFTAGIAPGMDLLAIDGHEYTQEGLLSAISDAKSGSQPIELLVKDQDTYRTVKVDYHDGLRYPHLERRANVPALLDAIVGTRK